MSSSRPVTISCTARGGVNIAVIKYWGKRDEQRILPINSSISATLSLDDMCTTTTATASSRFTGEDTLLLNNQPEDTGARFQACMKALRERAQDIVDEKGAVLVPAAELRKFGIHIISVNNFPTAAGLASSASGFATLVFCVAQILNVKEIYPGELSGIARMGSGSACRSLYGGWVKWQKGVREDGMDSIAVQLAPQSAWPLEVLVCVVSDKKKGVSSTSGMQTSVETSDLLRYRAQQLVEPRCAQMEAAIRNKDFPTFARLTMVDSNQFHAACLDTYPPIFYLNNVSQRVITLVHALNQPKIICAYTFDAGPNAVLYFPREHLGLILLHFFPPPAGAPLEAFLSKKSTLDELRLRTLADVSVPADVLQRAQRLEPEPGSLKYLLHTSVGSEPQVVSREVHFGPAL